MTNFINEQAKKVAVLESKIKYLDELFESGDLSDDGEDYVSEYTNVLAEAIEEAESNLYNGGTTFEDVQAIFNLAKTMKLTVDTDFINHVNNYI